MMDSKDGKRVMAIASKGGHWMQLMRLRPAWDDCDVTYVSTDKGYASEIEAPDGAKPPRFFTVPDASRTDKIKILMQMLAVIGVLIRVRPHVIVTTGAAPGFFALLVGRIFGAKTIWIDSIANADEVSLSGRKIRPYANLWLTQWPHLVDRDGPRYEGSVL